MGAGWLCRMKKGECREKMSSIRTTFLSPDACKLRSKSPAVERSLHHGTSFGDSMKAVLRAECRSSLIDRGSIAEWAEFCGNVSEEDSFRHYIRMPINGIRFEVSLAGRIARRLAVRMA